MVTYSGGENCRAEKCQACPRSWNTGENKPAPWLRGGGTLWSLIIRRPLITITRNVFEQSVRWGMPLGWLGCDKSLTFQILCLWQDFFFFFKSKIDQLDAVYKKETFRFFISDSGTGFSGTHGLSSADSITSKDFWLQFRLQWEAAFHPSSWPNQWSITYDLSVNGEPKLLFAVGSRKWYICVGWFLNVLQS